MDALARLWPGACVTLVALAGYLYAEATGRERLRWICKPIASTGFIAAALLVEAYGHPYGRAVLVALALSWWGDVLLIPQARVAFLAGLVAFLLGHVAFAVAFALKGLALPVALMAAVPLAVIAGGVYRWLRPKVPSRLRKPVVAYIVVITVMVVMAFGAWGAGAMLLVPVAALAFWLSDLSVARDRFADAGFGNRLWGLPLYYLAQLAFAVTAAG